jgi:hypothetical protein
MANPKANSPLLGYNTNVRHKGKLFHIQTEDSGVGHPHVITHLFVEGTILASKKTSYSELLEKEKWKDDVRQLMKDQHKGMFVQLRDGEHDAIAAKTLGIETVEQESVAPPSEPPAKHSQAPTVEIGEKGVVVIAPADMQASAKEEQRTGDDPIVIIAGGSKGRSIFDTPDNNGEFGENLITDKSLDEVILSYLTDELDE